MTIAKKLRQLALAALLAAAPSTQAALPYEDGDLILGFRASGGQGATTCYEVNIGHASNYVGVTSAFTVNLGGDIAADLVNIFGADWNTRGDVFWSVSGVQFVGTATIANRTIFASKAQPVAGTQSTPWQRVTLSTQNPVALRVQALGTPGYSTGTTATTPGQTESTNSTKALIQDTGAANSYASHMPGGSNSTVGSAYQFFVNGALGIENTFVNGTEASVIDLYQLTPGSPGTPATFLGAFRFNDSAQLTFTPNPGDFAGSAQVKFDSATYTVGENGVNATLTIVRSGDTDSAFTLNFSTSDGTALAGTDFTGQTNTPVVFGTGETSKTVNVAITDVPGFQGDRSFTATITLASGTANIATPSTATVTITDDDPQPPVLTFSPASYQVAENVGTGVVTLTINRAGSTSGALTVDFSTVDGTAVAGTDFTGQTNTTVNFASGQASATVDVAITNRAGFAGDRQFTATLANPTGGATIGTPGTATVTILETDTNPAGQIAFTSASYRFASQGSNGQPNTVVITLARTNGTAGAVSVNLALAAGGNLDAGDFTFTNPTVVNFADGEAAAVVNIPLTAAVGPLPGTFNLTLNNPTNGASVAGITNATVTIAAPDAKPPKLKVTSPKSGKSGPTVDVAGTVTEPDDLDRVVVTLNGGVPQNATLGAKVNGVTSFTLNGLTAENGPNTLLVQAFDVNGTASAVTTVKFSYANERPLLAGTYNGLVIPTGAAPPGGNVNNAVGLLTATVSKTGTFSGKLLIGGVKLSFKGVFGNNGAARFQKAYGTTLALASKGKVPVQFGDLALTIDQPTAKITGTLGSIATIDADRANFDGKTVLLDPSVLANKGKYTAVLPSETQSVLPASQFPQGDGTANISIGKKGSVIFIGKLADGTAVKGGTALSKDYRWPLFAVLYKKQGSISGFITISLADLANPNADSDMSAEDLLWLRPADAKAKHYTAGWPGGVLVDLLGASYRAPQKGDVTSVFPGLGPDDLVNGNAQLQFADGKITPGTIEKNINISAKNKITNAPATDKSFKATIKAATGELTGSFTHTDGSKPKFSAIIYQKGANAGAYGWFLSVVPKGGAAGEAGGVSVIAK